jgi:uncharacterized repeat protein (TIGR01451 family)
MRNGSRKMLPLTSVLALVLSAALVLYAQCGYAIVAKPAALTKQLLPIEDSHVMEGQPDTVSDGGKRYNMYVGWDEQRYLSERIYLKFDLRDLPAEAVIERAVLGLQNKYTPSIGESPYTPKIITVEAREVERDDWSESTLTWNNAPPMGSVLDTKTIEGAGTYVEWDVTSFVVKQFAGDKIVSIGLKSTNEGTDDAVVWFYSKDAGEDQPRPYLRISYSIGAAPPPTEQRGVQVAITPATQTGKPGGVLTYTVTVKNTGNVADNYTLSATDTLGWGPTISPTALTLAAGAEGTATLSITIPTNAENRDSTTITVKAMGAGIENTATCKAIAEVEALPPPPTAGFPWLYVAIVVIVVIAIVAAVLVKRK